MKVIVGAQALLGEAGGIRTYTASLLKQFQLSPLISSLHLLINNSIVDASTLLPDEAHEHRTLYQGTRRQLDQFRRYIPLPIRHSIGSALRGYRLRSRPDFVFHETNNLLIQSHHRSIVTIHDLSCLRFPEFHPPARVRLFEKYFEQSVDNAQHITTVSEAVKNELLDTFAVPAPKVTAIPLGTDHLLESDSIDPHPPPLAFPYFLVVGALEPRKNINLILDGLFALDSQTRAKVKIVHAGPTGWRHELFAEQVEEAIKERCWLELGEVSRPKLRALYRDALALLYPSVYEGFGLPPFEALAQGCPVILSDIPVFRELHSEGVYWVDTNDGEALASLLRDIIRDPETAHAAGSAARGSIVQRSWATTAKKTIEVYERV